MILRTKNMVANNSNVADNSSPRWARELEVWPVSSEVTNGDTFIDEVYFQGRKCFRFNCPTDPSDPFDPRAEYSLSLGSESLATDYVYFDSIYVPSDAVHTTAGFAVLIQWHGANGDDPEVPVGLQLWGGDMRVYQQRPAPDPVEILYQESFPFDQWLDFKWEITWGATGSTKLYMNSVEIASFSGANCDITQAPYAKVGLYIVGTFQPATVYHNEYLRLLA